LQQQQQMFFQQQQLQSHLGLHNKLPSKKPPAIGWGLFSLKVY